MTWGIRGDDWPRACAKGALRSDDEQSVDRAHLHVIVLRCIQLLGKGGDELSLGHTAWSDRLFTLFTLQPKVRLAQMDQVTSSTLPT